MRAPILCGLLLALGGVVASACNASSPVAFETTSFTASAIQGGTIDTTHTFAVGVCIGNGGAGNCNELCSGTLIAPNVVLTARHCIDAVPNPNAINCATDQFGAANGSAFWVTTYSSLLQSTQGWHKVKSITLPPSAFVCGNDIAILELTSNIAPAEAITVEPVGQYPMTDHNRYKTTQTAIGYGKTSAGPVNDAGTRRILQNVKVACIPGDPQIDCGPLPATFTANEYVAGDGTCQGDSGSGAFEQSNFNANTPVTMGILSRGGQSGNTCVGAIYTRTDAWRSLIVQAVTQGAKDGGYAVPAWTQAAPPQPDSGVPAKDASVPPGSDASTGPKAPLGGACTSAGDCTSNDCESFDNGVSYVCTQACGASSVCPTNFFCDRGFCHEGAAPTTPTTPTTTTTSSGCATSGAGGDAGAFVIAGLALMVGARRKRKP